MHPRDHAHHLEMIEAMQPGSVLKPRDPKALMPWQQRVQVEHDDLANKVMALTDFLAGDKVPTRDLLEMQLLAMRLYLKVLKQRMALW